MGGHQASLPVVIVWMQALSVPLLGAFAAWIAYQQWRTADRKVQIDLFDRRFAVYDAARSAVVDIVAKGKCDDPQISKYNMATDKAPLLFGPEVNAELETVHQAIIELAIVVSEMSDGPPYPDGAGARRSKAYLRVYAFLNNMPKLLEPYMKLDHKAPSWDPQFKVRRFRKPKA